MSESSYLVGSIVGMSSQAVSIDGSGETVTASLAGIYLYHDTDALSLIDQMLAAMVSAGRPCRRCWITPP